MSGLCLVASIHRCREHLGPKTQDGQRTKVPGSGGWGGGWPIVVKELLIHCLQNNKKAFLL